MNVQLYIEGELCDLTQSIQFPLTKTWDNLNDPTQIISDYTKTISLPITTNNSAIFGNLYRVDRLLLGGGNSNKGIYFDPTKKFKFELVHNNELVMEGYGKVNDVDYSDAKKTYNVTLYGKIGELFSEMQQVTFDKNSENADYIIPQTSAMRDVMSNDLIVSTINGYSPEPELSQANNLTDFVGYCLTNDGTYDGFDHTQYQIEGQPTFVSFADTLDQKLGATNSGTLFPDGLLQRQIGEYRSYLCKPYVFVNKIIQLLQKWVADNTDYTLNLDDSFFNANNPYWSKLVYMLNPLPLENESVNTIATPNDRFGTSGENGGDIIDSPNYVSKNYGEMAFLFQTTDTRYSESAVSLGNQLYLPVGRWDFSTVKTNAIQWNGQFTYTAQFGSTSRDEHFMMCVCAYRIVGDNWAGRTLLKRANIIFSDGTNQTQDVVNWYATYKGLDADVVIVANDEQRTAHSMQGTLDFNMMLPVTNNIVLTVQNVYQNTASDAWLANFKLLNAQFSEVNSYRSGSVVTLHDYMQTEKTPFEILMRYAKTFGLVFDLDVQTKTLTLMSRNKYFADYSITDWSSKVDISKDYKVTPVSFDCKYVDFSQDETDNALNKTTKTKTNYSFGTKRIITDYNFDNNSKKLFENCPPLIPSTEFQRIWSFMHDRKLYGQYSLNESLPAFYEKEGMSKSAMLESGAFAFWEGNQAKDQNDQQSLTISDDTGAMRVQNIYCYAQSHNGISINYLPLVTIWDATRSVGCTFAKPMMLYDNYCKANVSNNDFIYNNFWANYIGERYNVQNKLVTCYVYLTIADFKQFTHKQFVTIGTQLFFVNKISDYDLNNDAVSVKVELVQVQNIRNYTQGQKVM